MAVRVTWKTRLAAARAETRRLSYVDVEAETAWSWAARAVARREVAERLDGSPRGDHGAACAAWRAYDDALHEALEHAALVRDDGKTLRRVERALAQKTKSKE